MVERRLCITSCQWTQSAAYHASVDGTLLPPVMDRKLVDSRDNYTPPALLPYLEKGGDAVAQF